MVHHIGAYGGQVITGILVQVHLTVGSVSPKSILRFSHSSKMHNYNTYTLMYVVCMYEYVTFSNWQNPYVGFLRVTIVEKARWNPLEHFYLGK